MADHSPGGGHMDMANHRAVYEGFVKGAVILCLLCGYAVVALAVFRFMGSGNLLLGFGGLILGILAVLIDARSGSTRWLLSAGLLAIFGLLAAVSVS